MKLTVGDLKNKLVGVPDHLPVVFQGNEDGDYNDPVFCAEAGCKVDEEPSSTTCTGYVYSAFVRFGDEFVIDGAIDWIS